MPIQFVDVPNLFREIEAEVAATATDLAKTGTFPAGQSNFVFTIEPPKDQSHGDVSTNFALVSAKAYQRPPREIAQELASRLKERSSSVSEATIAGPGFVNLRLKDEVWREQIRTILTAGEAYGDSDLGQGAKVNVEYVSANPTGPMHVGHGRGAVFGDALARLLEKAGFAVTREYYINDAGVQINLLAHSVYWRYLEALKRRGIQSNVIPETLAWITEGAYPGDYLIPVGEKLADIRGASLLDVPASEWREVCANFGCIEMMALIRQDLEILGIKHDEFFSERLLHHKAKSGALLREYFLAIGSNPDKYFADPDLAEKSRIELAFEDLESKDLIYEGKLEPPKGKLPDDWEPREQVLFKATQSGDDVDRPLKKADGTWTYFASDIAYHYDKFRRGFNIMIDVWGADHGGYIKRMQAAVNAITDKRASLDVKICQLVNLTENGQPVKMSKRAGTFVTLRDVVDRVGKDVVRFIMLTRKNDAALDFDLAKVLEQSKDNPVFYVQYAHARAHSVFRNAAEEFPDLATDAAHLRDARLDRLTDKDELALIKLMATWPRMVESAAEAHEPHRIAFYLGELAAAFHGLWNKGNTDAGARFIVKGDAELTRARLALLRAMATVIASGLAVLGVTPVEEMR